MFYERGVIVEAIGEYIISVTSAAMVCGCVQSFFENKGIVSSVLKLLCGIFMSLIVLHPLLDIKLPALNNFSLIETENGKAIIAETQQTVAKQQREFISEKCETYISQKAEELGCSLLICVHTDETPPYTPNSVQISGTIAPYARGQLTKWINDNLAINTEDQIWTG